MRKVDTTSNPDYPCKYLIHGLCNIDGDVKTKDFPPYDYYGGGHCVRWDKHGHLRTNIKFSDCKNYISQNGNEEE